jgi:tetratricopeptide (TPR) repeat protein
MPPIMIVGIENYVNGSDNGRYRDFVTSRDKFMQFLSDEVIPFVEKDYPKKPHRTIVGHSYSATFAVHVFLKEPSLFNAYIASSPDLGDEEIIRLEDSSLNYLNERNNTLFLSSAMEGWAQKDVNRLDSMFKHKPQKGLSYQIKRYPDESHYSVFLKSYYDGIRYVFRMDPAETLKSPMDLTVQMLHEYYEKMQDIFGVPLKPPQTLTGEYGYNYETNWNNLDKALEFYKENAENYPNSAWVQLVYADALLKKGDKQNAITRYEKALALNPADADLKEKINKLKNEK